MRFLAKEWRKPGNLLIIVVTRQVGFHEAATQDAWIIHSKRMSSKAFHFCALVPWSRKIIEYQSETDFALERQSLQVEAPVDWKVIWWTNIYVRVRNTVALDFLSKRRRKKIVRVGVLEIELSNWTKFSIFVQNFFIFNLLVFIHSLWFLLHKVCNLNNFISC